MRNPILWLRTHKFEAHTLAFILIITPCVPMYLLAQRGAILWSWPLLVLVILGNLLVLLLK